MIVQKNILIVFVSLLLGRIAIVNVTIIQKNYDRFRLTIVIVNKCYFISLKHKNF